jgi:hypothetical protein
MELGRRPFASKGNCDLIHDRDQLAAYLHVIGRRSSPGRDSGDAVYDDIGGVIGWFLCSGKAFAMP